MNVEIANLVDRWEGESMTAYAYITNEKNWPDQPPAREFGVGDEVFAFFGNDIIKGKVVTVKLLQNLDDNSYSWEYTADFNDLSKPARITDEYGDFRYGIRFVKWNESGKRYLCDKILDRMSEEEKKHDRIMEKLRNALKETYDK